MSLWANTMIDRLPDGGPRYWETPPDPGALAGFVIAEPYNTVTAALFMLMIPIWLFRVRGNLRQFPFLLSCLPVLFVGGLGGTLYHAWRTQRIYFLLDVIPIFLLAAAGTIYLVTLLRRSYGIGKVIVYSLGLLLLNLFINGVMFSTLRQAYPVLTINLSYATMALIILIPLALVLIRTRFRNSSFVIAGLVAFAIAWFCRLVDPYSLLPMGTHWLWHLFGALSTGFLIEYFYRLEKENNTDNVARFLPAPASS